MIFEYERRIGGEKAALGWGWGRVRGQDQAQGQGQGQGAFVAIWTSHRLTPWLGTFDNPGVLFCLETP